MASLSTFHRNKVLAEVEEDIMATMDVEALIEIQHGVVTTEEVEVTGTVAKGLAEINTVQTASTEEEDTTATKVAMVITLTRMLPKVIQNSSCLAGFK